MCFFKGENLQVKVVLRYIIRKYKFDIGRYDSGTRRQKLKKKQQPSLISITGGP